MNNFLKKIKDLWVLILIGIIVIYSLFGIIKGQLIDYYLDNYSETINAIVINEKNYYVNNKVSNDFSYSYEFIFEEDKYKNDSQERNLTIGDSLVIEYYRNYPNFNRMLRQKNKILNGLELKKSTK